MKNFKELKKMYEGLKLNDEEFEEIEFSEYVATVENNGNSGVNPFLTWYTVYSNDGCEFDIYA